MTIYASVKLMPTLRSRVTSKIRDYRDSDKYISQKYPEFNQNLSTISTDEGLEIVRNCGKICPGCGCKMKFRNYKPWCLYQFTFDRIDNKVIHSKDNLRLACYNCNATEYDSPKFSCIKLCHESDIGRDFVKLQKERVVRYVNKDRQIPMKLLRYLEINTRHSTWKRKEACRYLKFIETVKPLKKHKKSVLM